MKVSLCYADCCHCHKPIKNLATRAFDLAIWQLTIGMITTMLDLQVIKILRNP